MEALAALSMACNVFQVVSFAGEVISVAKNIRRSGTPDPTLSSSAAQLNALSAQLETSIRNTTPVLPQTGAYADLLAMARECGTASAEIQAELRSIATSRAGALGKMTKALIKRGNLERLEQAMQQHRQVLESRLLADVWYVGWDCRSP